MSELVRILGMLIGRPVVDKTGVTGTFDMQLDFLPDDSTPALPPPPAQLLSRAHQSSARFQSNSDCAWNRRRAQWRS